FILGSSIIIELVIEGQLQSERPYFTITGVAHDYYDFFGYIFYKDGTEFAERIDDCVNIDINCSIGNDWQTQKRSVALMVVNMPRAFIGRKDVGYCTGSLINNTDFDARSLYLTANHCLN